MSILRVKLAARAVLFCVLVFLSACSKPHAYDSFHVVRKVIDGDTLILKNGQHVRLLGINAPEIARKNKPGEAGGRAAARWLKRQVEGKDIYLLFDQQKKDNYGRVLAYIFNENNQHINLELVKDGLAIASIIPPNVEYSDKFLSAQSKAQKERLGIWKKSAYFPVDVKTVLRKDRFGWKRILATPVAVLDDKKRDKKFVRLVINKKIDVRIPRRNLRHFPNINTYIGKKLEVRGWVSKRKGHYSILVRHPSVLVDLGSL